MVIRLTDFKWELDLFLFDTGFDAFWKLTPGTVIAVLNPGIMPPKDRATGAFSLKLSSSEDTVLEIGTSKDLGFCNAVKSNGMECLQWIDGRKTEVCEYHIALKVDKARKGRMQLNTMTNGRGNRDGQGGGSRGGRGGRGGGRGGLKQEGKQYDSYLHETMYLAPKEAGFSATRLLDDRDADVNAWQRGYSREEMQRRRKQARDKEAELAKKLGALGGSAGSEYLKSRADGQARRAAAANPAAQETEANPAPGTDKRRVLGPARQASGRCVFERSQTETRYEFWINAYGMERRFQDGLAESDKKREKRTPSLINLLQRRRLDLCSQKRVYGNLGGKAWAILLWFLHRVQIMMTTWKLCDN